MAISRAGFLVATLLATSGCPRSSPVPEIETHLTRPHLMGFSVIPPKPDVTNGLARESEAVALVAARRSITDPAIQRLYRSFVLAVVERLRPDYLGLAAETNLVRAIAPRPVYDALVRMTTDAAAEVRAAPSGKTLPLYISVQVETAWGRLGPRSAYAGIDQDLRDFPFITALGLSSYPYLGGFSEPESIPLEYYSRINSKRPLPLLIVEGGWPSASVRGAFTSSAAMQARYVARHSQLLEHANAIATRTYIYARFLPNGKLEASVTVPDEEKMPTVVLREVTPHTLGIYEVRYAGQNRSWSVRHIHRDLDPGKGFTLGR